MTLNRRKQLDKEVNDKELMIKELINRNYEENTTYER